jgi:uncharacterized protein YfeS
MRLFSLMNAGAVDDPDFGHFDPDPDTGAFDFPEGLADRLRTTHYRKRQAWETEVERNDRLHGDEMARQRDPATLYNAVGEIANMGKELAALRAASGDETTKAELAQLREQLAALTAQLSAQPGDVGSKAAPRGGRRAAASTTT